MPIRAKYELKCSKCGKSYTVTIGDAIMPKDKEKLDNPVCKICKIKKFLKFSK